MVCMEVKGNKCLKKEAVVLTSQCYRVGPQDKAEDDCWVWQLPWTGSLELFDQSHLTVRWRINEDRTGC